MFKKLLSGIMAVVLCVVGLSGCGESKTEEVEMPDVVFVLYHHYPLEKEYNTGTFIGIEGYYIEKSGKIKYFEFESAEPAFDYENLEISIDEYCKLRDMENLHKKIIENSYDTEYENIPQEELTDCYKMLNKINTKTKLKCESSYIDIVWGTVCIYGVKNKGDLKFVPIYETGELYYNNNDSNAEKLSEQLLSLYSAM